VSRGLGPICGLALAMVAGAAVQVRDFEMGGDSPYVYSSIAPTPNAATHHRATASHSRRAGSHQAAKPVAKQ
jgi:hypothetical protein